MFNATLTIFHLHRGTVLLVEETGENHRPVASYRQTLSHNFVLSAPRLGLELE